MNEYDSIIYGPEYCHIFFQVPASEIDEFCARNEFVVGRLWGLSMSIDQVDLSVGEKELLFIGNRLALPTGFKRVEYVDSISTREGRSGVWSHRSLMERKTGKVWIHCRNTSN